MTPEQSFRPLLAHAWRHSPLYRGLYTQHGIRERDLPHVALHDLPVVTKSDVMMRFDEAVTDPRLRLVEVTAWLARDANPRNLYLDEYVVIHSSAGSAIRSVVPCTLRKWRVMTTSAAPALLTAELDGGRPMRSAFYFAATGHFVSSTNVTFASHSAHEILWTSVFDPVEEVWARLNAFQPERLTSYASTMAWLAQWTREGKLDIHPRSVVVSGDRLTPQARALIQEAWGIDAHDLYAAAELPYLAVRAPGRREYRVFTDLTVLEVVDASHRMVSPGQRGRVLLTDLVNQTLPLIRFDLQDEAIAGAVGFGAETLERIDGKAHVRLPVRRSSGEVTSLPLHALHALDGIGCTKIQFVTHGPDDVEIRYEAERNLGAEIETAFRALLAAESATVRRIRVQRLPRLLLDSVSRKFWDVVTPDQAFLPLLRLSDQRATAPRTPLRPLNAALQPGLAPAPSRSVAQRFDEIAARHPDHVAATDGERPLTYRELRRAAQRIAGDLLRRRFDPGRPVVVLGDHRIEMIPPIMGVLAAGGFYLALDAATPRGRLRTVLAETQPEYVVAVGGHEALAQALVDPSTAVLPLDELLTSPAVDIPLPDPSPVAPACLLFTSGSMGTPKGVVLNHENVLHRARRYAEDFGLGPDDRLTLLQSFAVSAGVRDLFGALLTGASLAVYDLRSRGIQALPQWLIQQRISVFYAVPTVWRLLQEVLGDERFPSLRAVRLGGEAVQPRDLAAFKARFPARCVLVNGYAATETDTICQHVMDHDTEIVANRLSVGTPVRGMSVRIEDDDGRPVVGALGNVVVSGDAVASGTWDPIRRQIRPEQSPLAIGDVGYQLPDGRIFLTGRRDSIVKVHGHRIHLDEIERAAVAVEGVSEAVAVPHVAPDGATTAVVYYVPAPGTDVAPDTVRRAVVFVLPGSAAAVSCVPLPALPRLLGGKVNRHLLPRPTDPGVQLRTEPVAYRTPVEAALARIWSEVLGVPVIPAAADFFALGGDSVSAFRVLTRIHAAFDVEVAVQDFFDHATIEGLALTIVQALAARSEAL